MLCPFQRLVDPSPVSVENVENCVAEMSAGNARGSVVQIFAELAKPDFRVVQTASWVNLVNALLFKLSDY